MDAVIKSAYEIAKRDLRSNYRLRGIHAGNTHFSDFWTRDFCFASLGATKLQDFEVVKKGIENFLKFQKEDGFIPFLIGTRYFILKYLGLPVKHRVPTYGDHKSKSTVVDQNPLLVMASLNYIKESKDTDFAKRYFLQLKKAVDWSISRDIDSDYLTEEKYFANWADSVRKNGKVLYSNVCFYKSVLDFAEICKICREKSTYVKYMDIARRIKKAINDNFWNGSHYDDWIDNGEKYNFFATDGNMLAIMWGIADKEKSFKIIAKAKETKIDSPVPCRTNYPKYPKRFESRLMWFIALGDYHNASLAWLWLGCCMAVAQKRAGMKKEAIATLYSIADTINKYEMVYEVYEKNGKPVKRFIYKSEIHFAWSSGMFIYAVNEVFGKKDKKNK